MKAKQKAAKKAKPRTPKPRKPKGVYVLAYEYYSNGRWRAGAGGSYDEMTVEGVIASRRDNPNFRRLTGPVFIQLEARS